MRFDVQGGRRVRVALVVAGVLLSGVCAAGGAVKMVSKRASPSGWEEAERLRKRLESTPLMQRTKPEYDRVLDSYRAVYHGNPADLHAPASVFAVAELLAEEGRSLRDPARFKMAVAQFEFLRKEYPRSSLRWQALLGEARVEAGDLHQSREARAGFQAVIAGAPQSQAAAAARAGLTELNHPAVAAGRNAAVGNSTKNEVEAAGVLDEAALRSRTEAAMTKSPADVSVSLRKDLPEAALPVPVNTPAMPTPTQAGKAAEPIDAADRRPATTARGGQLAAVTAIRHWSTPTYTRVVIDLGDHVTYEAARVPKPDRIYFDLHGTRLAAELAGRTFAVTDDGFLKRIRAAQFRNQLTRVVLDVNDVTEYTAFLLPNPYRLIIDIHGKGPARAVSGTLPSEATLSRPGREVTVNSPLAAGPVTPTASPVTAQPLPQTAVPNTTEVRSSGSSGRSKGAGDVARLSTEPGVVDATRQPTSEPIAAMVMDMGGRTSSREDRVTPALPERRTKDRGAVPARAATPTAGGETSLIRALGLKIGRIVIDAGHGGHDSGTLGAEGVQEKDVVLDVALRLGRLLHDRLNAEIVYTRSDDTFVALEDRTAIANKAQADLFLSIHANSSEDETARGVETYYLNFTSQQDALAVAARENAVSGQSIHELSNLVKKIAMKDKIEESREFAGNVEQGLYAGLKDGNSGLKNRGVKKAPFVVLIGANMPSVLAEISFVSNPKDARQLQRPEYRERVAESLYKGVAKYASGLSESRMPVQRASGP